MYLYLFFLSSPVTQKFVGTTGPYTALPSLDRAPGAWNWALVYLN